MDIPHKIISHAKISFQVFFHAQGEVLIEKNVDFSINASEGIRSGWIVTKSVVMDYLKGMMVLIIENGKLDLDKKATETLRKRMFKGPFLLDSPERSLNCQ